MDRSTIEQLLRPLWLWCRVYVADSEEVTDTVKQVGKALTSGIAGSATGSHFNGRPSLASRSRSNAMMVASLDLQHEQLGRRRLVLVRVAGGRSPIRELGQLSDTKRRRLSCTDLRSPVRRPTTSPPARKRRSSTICARNFEVVFEKRKQAAMMFLGSCAPIADSVSASGSSLAVSSGARSGRKSRSPRLPCHIRLAPAHPLRPQPTRPGLRGSCEIGVDGRPTGSFATVRPRRRRELPFRSSA